MTWLNDLCKKGTKKNIRNQIEELNNLERSTLLNKPNAVREFQNVIPFSVTYSPTF